MVASESGVERYGFNDDRKRDSPQLKRVYSRDNLPLRVGYLLDARMGWSLYHAMTPSKVFHTSRLNASKHIVRERISTSPPGYMLLLRLQQRSSHLEFCRTECRMLPCASSNIGAKGNGSLCLPAISSACERVTSRSSCLLRIRCDEASFEIFDDPMDASAAFVVRSIFRIDNTIGTTWMPRLCSLRSRCRMQDSVPCRLPRRRFSRPYMFPKRGNPMHEEYDAWSS